MATRRARPKSARRSGGLEPEFVHEISSIELRRGNVEILLDRLSDEVGRVRVAVRRTRSEQLLKGLEQRLAAALRTLAADPERPRSQNLEASLIEDVVRRVASAIPNVMPDAEVARLRKKTRWRGELSVLDTPSTLVSEAILATLNAWGIASPAAALLDGLPHFVQSAILFSKVRPGAPSADDEERAWADDATAALDRGLRAMGLPHGDRQRERGRAGRRVP